jgi:hypothetical protein
MPCRGRRSWSATERIRALRCVIVCRTRRQGYGCAGYVGPAWLPLLSSIINHHGRVSSRRPLLSPPRTVSVSVLQDASFNYFTRYSSVASVADVVSCRTERRRRRLKTPVRNRNGNNDKTNIPTGAISEREGHNVECKPAMVEEDGRDCCVPIRAPYLHMDLPGQLSTS